MLARRELPPEYKAFNRKWHAPFGRKRFVPRFLAYSRPNLWYRGPFGRQINNATRVFEYPWAVEQINNVGKNLDVLEIGGGLSGLQVVLARQGHHVTNVDPGLKAEGKGFEVEHNSHDKLCKAFGVSVKLISDTIQTANLLPESADVIVCISALEHFSESDVRGFAEHVQRILRPKGRLVMTVDLFIDVFPFCKNRSNKWGTNINLKSFLEMAQLKLLVGNRAELYGFDEFHTDDVLCNSSNYVFVPPSFVQCLVAGR